MVVPSLGLHPVTAMAQGLSQGLQFEEIILKFFKT